MLRLSTPCGKPLLKSVTCLAVLSVSHTPLFPYNSTCARHFSVPRNSPLFQLLYRYAEGNHRLLMSIFEKSEGWFSIKPDTQNIDIKKASTSPKYLWCFNHVFFFTLLSFATAKIHQYVQRCKYRKRKERGAESRVDNRRNNGAGMIFFVNFAVGN